MCAYIWKVYYLFYLIHIQTRLVMSFVNHGPVLPSPEQLRQIRRRWRIARSLLRRAIQTVDVVYRMEGVPDSVREDLLYQRGQLSMAMNNLEWMVPTSHRSLDIELNSIYEAEEMDANVDCLNSVIEDYYPVLPMLGAEVED